MKTKTYKKSYWEHPSYNEYLFGLILLLIPIILIFYNRGINIIMIAITLIYVILSLFVIKEFLHSRRSLMKTFHEMNTNKAIKIIDSLLKSKDIPFNKKKEINNKFFLKLFATELYKIKNEKLFIKIISNAESTNSINIIIDRISNENQKFTNSLIKEIDKNLD